MTARPRVSIVVSLDGLRTRTARFVTGSMAVHATLLAAILIVPATRHRAAPIDDSIVVALAGPIAETPAPRGGATSTPVVPPAPLPAPPPKEARTVPEVPHPTPKPKKEPVKPTPEPEKTKESGPPTPSPAPGPPVPGPPVPGPTHGGVPGPGAGAVTATVGGGESALGWYGAAVKAALESVWI